MPFLHLMLKMRANPKAITAEFPKQEPFNLQFRKLWVQNQTEKNFPLHLFQNLSISREFAKNLRKLWKMLLQSPMGLIQT